MAGLLNSRDEYAEQTVRDAQSAENFAATMATSLQSVEGIFPLATSSSTSTSGLGIGGDLNDLLSAFSSLTTNPNDTASRQSILNAAGNLATAVGEAYSGLTTVEQNTYSQASSYVQEINSLITEIHEINVASRSKLRH